MTQRVFVVGDVLLGSPLTYNRKSGWEKEFFKCWQHTVKKDDVVVLNGNTAVENIGAWFSKIKEQAGSKILFLGPQDQRRANWYSKFGFDLIKPFGTSLVYEHDWGNIFFSYFPAFTLQGMNTDKFLGFTRKMGKEFDASSSILNIHSYTRGQATPRHNTFDCGLDFIGPQLITLEQVLAQKFKKEAV